MKLGSTILPSVYWSTVGSTAITPITAVTASIPTITDIAPFNITGVSSSYVSGISPLPSGLLVLCQKLFSP